METTAFARCSARIWGALWFLAGCANALRVLTTAVAIQSRITEIGFAAVGVALTGVILYSAVQIVGLRPRVRSHLKVIAFVSLLPILARGVLPIELAAWIFLDLTPSMLLLGLFRPPMNESTKVRQADQSSASVAASTNT